MTNKSLGDIAKKYNSAIRGWPNYYGKYGKKELAKVLESINYHLCFWLRRKYKKYKTKYMQARRDLLRIANKCNSLFEHWKVGILPKAG
jgi:RNA-directed DNA polymerase